MSSGILRLVYEYRNLLGRRDIVHMPLGDEERHELAELEQRFLWTGEATNVALPMALRRRFLRMNVRLTATMKVGREFTPVSIIDIGGGGLMVEPAPRLQVGDLTVVKVQDPTIGREYHLPAQVAWRQVRPKTSRMGLAFFGIPIELRYGGGRSGLADDAAA